MRSKTAVIVAVVFILVIGAAALAVNTRILNASSTSDIGRADQVLIPGTLPAGSGTSTPAGSGTSTPAGSGTSTQQTFTPPATAPTDDDEEGPDEEHSFPHRSEHEPDD
ncbi:hypothetical protein [Rhodococcus zopfii]|uniref:hypothetical protein n=1 Tax=Rhodococcus zopfii TaxID=43772 RepID=UPI00111120F3|nr:hypothetical protein [Rhodococcus zopfii]